MIGIIALESQFIGKERDQLQVVFLHGDQQYRDKGIGYRLMKKVIRRAKNLGAKKLYLSTTPSKHTVQFYFSLGCRLASEINADLYDLEPEDIHLELELY